MGLRSIYRYGTKILSRVFGAERVLKLEAKIRFKRTLDINNPKTLSDKLCYLEFRRNNPLVLVCTDKYEVRNYIKSRGLENILVPTYGEYYTSVDDIDFEMLPNQFVLKATHGCQMNLICPDKQKLDVAKVKRVLQKWLDSDFERSFIEPHYKNIPHRIVCEKFLDNAETIIDYKIHCFNGEPKFILVCSDRLNGFKLNLYDLSWIPVYEIQGPHKTDKEIAKPSKLNEMLEISKRLAKDFEFVRVDLYQIHEKIYFGELTFTPAGGIVPYFKEQFNAECGVMLKLV